jgi:hypothetical protein
MLFAFPWVCLGGKVDSAHVQEIIAIAKLAGSPNGWPFNLRFTESFAMRLFAVSTAVVLAVTVAAAQERTPSPAGAEVYFISPKDGATVSSPFVVQFGLKGMGVVPAGIKFANSGHHHLLIDSDAPVDLNAPLTANDQLIHFGRGQTQATVTLPPGKHTLQLLLGDHDHRAHNPPVFSKKITVTVTQ